MCNPETEKFKEHFFDLPSRVFGETYVQPILYKYLKDKRGQSNSFDAERDLNGAILRGEYKAVRVVFEQKEKGSMYDVIMSSLPISKRIGTLKDISDGKIVANCQNIKPDDFDYLVYVLVDKDGFHIFEISANEFKEKVNSKEFPNYSPNHGRKEKGLNGQFPIRNINLDWHKNKTLKGHLTWEEIIKICKGIYL